MTSSLQRLTDHIHHTLLTFMLQLDAQIGVALARKSSNVLDEAAADLAALARELHHVTNVEIGGRARTEGTLTGDETRIPVNKVISSSPIHVQCESFDNV